MKRLVQYEIHSCNQPCNNKSTDKNGDECCLGKPVSDMAWKDGFPVNCPLPPIVQEAPSSTGCQGCSLKDCRRASENIRCEGYYEV
jgi:hypothetical protein